MQRTLLNPAVESVSAFFPCFNDAPTIAGVVEACLEAMEEAGVEGDLTVVDDGSTDESAAVLADLAARHPNVSVVRHDANRGYGGALISGFDAATTGQWAFYTDGDGQFDPSELAALIKAAEDGVDVVQGYKTRRADHWIRRVIGRVYHHGVKLLFGLRIRDTDCDFRLVRRSALDRISLHEETGAICVELVRKLQDTGARFVEVPVSHHPRVHGRSRFFRPARIAQSLARLARLWVRLVVLRRP